MEGCGKLIGFYGHPDNKKYQVICGKKGALCPECSDKSRGTKK